MKTGRTITVRGTVYDVHVSDELRFYCLVGEAKVYGESTEKLNERMMSATKVASVKANIEFWRWKRPGVIGANGKLCKGAATCLHAVNGNLVIKWDGEKQADQESVSNYHKPSTGQYMRLTETEREQLTKLYIVEETARDKRAAFEKEHSFDPAAELRAMMPKEQP